MAETPSTRAPAIDVQVHNGPPGTFRLNDQGNAIDAHDGEIRHFGDRYYLYGTSYGCGFRWNDKSAPFCDFRVYSSTDLMHWRNDGPLFDTGTPAWQKRCDGATYGCFRPHVIYNASTRRYVLWINTYEVPVGYHVFTAAQPTGPFVEAALPKLAINTSQPAGLNHGDHDIFVDRDGTAYLAFTDWRRKGDIVVEQLDANYLSGTGHYVRLGLKATEAPSLFRRGDTYYLAFSDPNCGYCATGTSYMHAASPLGPWIGQSDTGKGGLHRGFPISKDSCGGQPAAVNVLPGRDGPVFLYQSDRWHHGDVNEALATHYWEPLRFDAAGRIQPLTCADTFELAIVGVHGGNANNHNADRDRPLSATASAPDIHDEHQRAQVVAMSHDGRLDKVMVAAFRQANVDGPLQLSVARVEANGQPGAVIASRTVPPAEVSWSPSQVGLCVGANVRQGEKIAVLVTSTASGSGYGVLLAQARSAGTSHAWTRSGGVWTPMSESMLADVMLDATGGTSACRNTLSATTAAHR
ncbi:family 43 glycosylhydrolase [Rhodanobacter sp. Col0626]|uniref:family 43 glycosylhydrolase n=1 Tax=Rhodanobacter sp. Col0626 TaxID=3415679 RepID=UPI003CF58B94